MLDQRTGSGISGLDHVLCGGLPKGSVTILEGEPGTGKTTVGLQFLVEGALQKGEAGLFITFEQLPEQLYADAASFGWDLKELERRQMLRIIAMEPDILFEQMTAAGGLFERIVKQLDCRRVVIDSISLFRSPAAPREARTSVYTMRNILRKLSLTSLLIREYSGYEAQHAPFENNVCDGIVRLSLKPHMEKYRKRTVEVLKMRGTRIMEGEHHFSFTKTGIHVIPALSMAEEKLMTHQADMLTTGIPCLDELLSGGIPRGSVFMIDTNSKANHKYLLTSIFAERLKAGERTLSMMSNITGIEAFAAMLSLYGVSLEDTVKEGRSHFIEHYEKPVPEQYEDAIFRVGDMGDDEYQRATQEHFAPIVQPSLRQGDKWFVYYDLNTIFSQRGKDFVTRYFTAETVKCRSAGITVLAHCNFSEIGQETASFLERTCNGVIRTWVDGKYQYLQVTKSPTGRMSAPKMIENIHDRPYIRLI